jgi:hypothetical protein
MKIGSLIKSYDFNGVTDTYMIGRVVDIMDVYILCDTVEIVWEGVSVPIKESRRQFRTVKQGAHMFDNPKAPRIVELV